MLFGLQLVNIRISETLVSQADCPLVLRQRHHIPLHEPPSLTVIALTVVGMHQRLIAVSPSETPNLTSFPKKKKNFPS